MVGFCLIISFLKCSTNVCLTLSTCFIFHILSLVFFATIDLDLRSKNKASKILSKKNIYTNYSLQKKRGGSNYFRSAWNRSALWLDPFRNGLHVVRYVTLRFLFNVSDRCRSQGIPRGPTSRPSCPARRSWRIRGVALEDALAEGRRRGGALRPEAPRGAATLAGADHGGRGGGGPARRRDG